MKTPWTLGRNLRVVMDADGERVADCRNEDVGDEARDEANARLVVAAPDMLEICRLMATTPPAEYQREKAKEIYEWATGVTL